MVDVVQIIVKNSGACEVLGIHYTGPNAGEVMQGFAVALRSAFFFFFLWRFVSVASSHFNTT